DRARRPSRRRYSLGGQRNERKAVSVNGLRTLLAFNSNAALPEDPLKVTRNLSGWPLGVTFAVSISRSSAHGPSRSTTVGCPDTGVVVTRTRVLPPGPGHWNDIGSVGPWL